MNKILVLKAISDDTRMKILFLLLKHNYCVRALAKKVKLSESTVSQHLKVLRQAGLLIGDKRGYFMHYSVDRSVLHELAKEIEALANIEQEACLQKQENCPSTTGTEFHKKNCSDETKEYCHGSSAQEGG
jgi:ArsR family transcriptional regulator